MDLSRPTMNYFNQTKNEMFQNSGYCDTRINKQILILDLIEHGVSSHGATNFESGNINFTANLHEPLKIDTLSDIYLDNFTTTDVQPNTATSCEAFVISINEFQIKSNSNNSKLYNKIIIPNEQSTAGDKLIIHKARKMNYICSINPCTLTKLSGIITNIAGKTMDGKTGSKTYRVIAEFIIVARQ